MKTHLDRVAALRRDAAVRGAHRVKISGDAALAVHVVAGGAVDLDALEEDRGSLIGVMWGG